MRDLVGRPLGGRRCTRAREATRSVTFLFAIGQVFDNWSLTRIGRNSLCAIFSASCSMSITTCSCSRLVVLSLAAVEGHLVGGLSLLFLCGCRAYTFALM